MKLLVKMQFGLGVLVTVLVLLGGCAEVGLLSKQQTFNGVDSILLDSPREDILDVIAAVGENMKYDVSSLDKDAREITLSSNSSGIELIGIGKESNSQLAISITNEWEKINIRIFVNGNFGTGNQNTANEILNTFKERLSEQLASKN